MARPTPTEITRGQTHRLLFVSHAADDLRAEPGLNAETARKFRSIVHSLTIHLRAQERPISLWVDRGYEFSRSLQDSTSRLTFGVSWKDQVRAALSATGVILFWSASAAARFERDLPKELWSTDAVNQLKSDPSTVRLTLPREGSVPWEALQGHLHTRLFVVRIDDTDLARGPDWIWRAHSVNLSAFDANDTNNLLFHTFVADLCAFCATSDPFPSASQSTHFSTDPDAEIRVFFQFLNAEICKIYGTDPTQVTINPNGALLALRYALFLATDYVIVPASCFLEHSEIHTLLPVFEVLAGDGALQVATPALTLDDYFEQKISREYRGHDDYGRHLRQLSHVSPLPSLPRSRHDTATDLKLVWDRLVSVGELFGPQGMAEIASRTGLPLLQLEAALLAAPTTLDGKAFIHEHIRDGLSFLPTPREDLQIAVTLSREYLRSYLDEFDATLLFDSPVGMFDCGYVDPSGNPARKMSLRSVRRAFENAGVRPLFESLTWEDLIKVRSDARAPLAVTLTRKRLMMSDPPLVPALPREVTVHKGDEWKHILDVLVTKMA